MFVCNLGSLRLVVAVSAVVLSGFVGCDRSPTPPTPTPTPAATPGATVDPSSPASQAQTMIDSAKAYIAKGDFTQAKEVLTKLQSQSFYASLPQGTRDTVDQLIKKIPTGATSLPRIPALPG